MSVGAKSVSFLMPASHPLYPEAEQVPQRQEDQLELGAGGAAGDARGI